MPSANERRAGAHAMCDDPKVPKYKESCDSGHHVYEALLDFQKAKPVYVLASHSHFYMENIFGKLPPARIPVIEKPLDPEALLALIGQSISGSAS